MACWYDEHVMQNGVCCLCKAGKQLFTHGQAAKCTFHNCNGESQAWLTQQQKFVVRGGSWGPSFGGRIECSVDYDAHKDEIHQFLNFLLGDNDSDPETSDPEASDEVK